MKFASIFDLILELQRIRIGGWTHRSALDELPAAEGPGDGRRERDGDGDPHGEQRLVAEERERERAAARRDELHRPVARRPLRPFLKDITRPGRECGVAQGLVAGGGAGGRGG